MKNLITLIILAIFLFIDCQAQPRWYGDEVFYPHMTSLGSTSWIQVNDNGQTKVISGPALASYLGAGSTLLAGNNPWAGSNSFSLPVQMAGEYDLTKDYAVSFHNSKYGYTLNGAWNQFVLASEIASYLGDAGDASTFVTKAGNDTITGWKRFNNTLYIYGSTEYQAGTLLNLPYWSNISTLPSYRIAYTIRGGRAVPMWKDGVNPPSRLVDSVYLASQSLGSQLPSTGTKTSITSLLYWSTGGIRYVSSATGTSSTSARAGMPVYSAIPATTSHYNGDIFTVGGLSDTDGSGLPLNGIYFIWVDQDYNKQIGFAPSQTKVQRMIDRTVTFDPLTITTSTIDLDLGKNKFYYVANTDVTFNITNVKNTTFEVLVASQGVNIAFTVPSGYTLKWVNGLIQPDQGDYKYIFEVWGTSIYAYLGWIYQ